MLFNVSFAQVCVYCLGHSPWMQDYFNEEDDDDPRRASTSGKRPSSPELHSEGVGRPFVKMRSASPPTQRPPSKVWDANPTYAPHSLICLLKT